eukprot:2609484-Heterocapsa_arctica.AAC.1
MSGRSPTDEQSAARSSSSPSPSRDLSRPPRSRSRSASSASQCPRKHWHRNDTFCPSCRNHF